MYEPLVALIDGRTRETSRASASHTAEGAGSHHHRACYEELEGAGSIAA